MIDLETIGYFLFMEEQEQKRKQELFVVENENLISTEERPPIYDFPKKD